MDDHHLFMPQYSRDGTAVSLRGNSSTPMVVLTRRRGEGAVSLYAMWVLASLVMLRDLAPCNHDNCKRSKFVFVRHKG